MSIIFAFVSFFSSHLAYGIDATPSAGLNFDDPPSAPKTCVKNYKNLTTGEGPLVGPPGEVMDQDGVGVCYATSSSLLVAGSLGSKVPVSYLDLAMLNPLWQDKAKVMDANGKVQFNGGMVCATINEAQKRGYACARSSVALEEVSNGNGRTWGVANPAIQLEFLTNIGKFLDLMHSLPDDKKQVWSSSPVVQNLLQVAQNARCEPQEDYSESIGLGNLSTLCVESMVKDYRGLRTRLAELAISTPALTIDIERASLQQQADELEAVLKPLVDGDIRDLQTDLSINEDIKSAISLDPEFTRLIKEDHGLLQQMRESGLQNGNTPVIGSVFEGLVSQSFKNNGIPPGRIKQCLKDRTLALLGIDFRNVDRGDCQTAALVEALQQVAQESSSPFCRLLAAQDVSSPQLRELNTILESLAFNLKDSNIPIPLLAKALQRASSPSDLQHYMQDLIAPECSSDKANQIVIPQTASCVDSPFPSPALVQKAQAESKSNAITPNGTTPRTAADLDYLRPEFQSAVKGVLDSNRPVALSICSIVLAQPDSADTGNSAQNCTTGIDGYHAVTVVGYREKCDGTFDYLIQNSWGASSCPGLTDCAGAGKGWLSEDAVMRNTVVISSMSSGGPSTSANAGAGVSTGTSQVRKK